MNNLPERLSLPHGLEIELVGRDGIFQGIGAVRAEGVLLRAPTRPMFVEIRTPRGETMRDFRCRSTQALPDGGCVLKFEMNVQASGIMDWMVHEVRNRVVTDDWTKAPQPAAQTSLELEIHPVSRFIGHREYSGFSYQYRYRSELFPIYKILDRATWELGGNAIGNEFWMRNAFVPSIVHFENAEQFYSSEWYIPDCANPSAFQFLPLQTELQGFSFAASAEGVLLTWPREVAHVRSLFEKPRGENRLVHFHEHCGDLSSNFSTSPMEVLFAPGCLNRVELFNAHEAIREVVHEALHEQIGMRRERVTTYGQIEEWGPADLEYYTRQGVPKLLEAGCKTIYFANHFQNNMNTWGVGNFCCTVDYQVAESVDKEKLRALCKAIIDGGADSMMWGNTSISALSWIFDWDRREPLNPDDARIEFLPRAGSIMEALEKAAAPFVRNAANAMEADHYTPIFCVLNLRDPAVREYWLRRWREACDDIGLRGIFLDSSFNLSSDKFHWVQNTQPESTQGATADQTHLLGNFRPPAEPASAILSQYHAHLELMREMQASGYLYCNEDLGVFGIHRHGPGIAARLDNLPLWSECIAPFDTKEIEKAGGDADDIFFRGLAYRMMWGLHWNIARDESSWNYTNEPNPPTAWHLKLLKAFNQVGELMDIREILPDEAGVLWRAHAGAQVLWAFSDFMIPLESPCRVSDLLNASTTEALEVRARRHGIYLIEK